MIGSEPRVVAMGLVVAVVALLRDVPAETAAGDTGVLVMYATTLTAPAETWTISLSRWPSDAERAPVTAALSVSPARQGGPAGAPGDLAAGGRAATGPANAASPATTAVRGNGGSPATPAGGRGGRGAARGGRGGAAPSSPLARLTSAIKAAPTLGFIWGSGVTGYSIKYAWRSPDSGPPERVVLITERRLGLRPASTRDNPVSPAASPAPDADGDFTLIEIRFDAAGRGEGRTSLTSPIVIDQAAGTLALDRDATIPVLLRISR